MKIFRNYDILREAEATMPSWKTFWKKDHNSMSGITKRRRLRVPMGEKMQEIQEVLKNRVRGLSGKMPSATGCRKGISVLDSLLRHQCRFRKTKVFNRFFCIFDLKSAYRSVNAEELALILAQINPKQFSGYRRTVDFLENFCFDPTYGGVAMGAPASNELFNVYCEFRIDRELRKICEDYHLTYTRYVDDLVFSSQRPIDRKVREQIREVIENAGFEINNKKARIYDLRRGPVEINGVGITFEGKTFLPRRVLVSLRGMIHCAINDAQVRKELIHRIHGLMGFFKSVTDMTRLNQTERHLLEQYKELRKIVAKDSTIRELG